MYKTKLRRIAEALKAQPKIEGNLEILLGSTMEQVPKLKPRVWEMGTIQEGVMACMDRGGVNSDNDRRLYSRVIGMCEDYLSYNPNYFDIEGIYLVSAIKERLEKELNGGNKDE